MCVYVCVCVCVCVFVCVCCLNGVCVHSSHTVTSDLTISETARAAEFFLSDGVIVTGQTTGAPVDKTELDLVKVAISLPLLVGSGVTSENVKTYSTIADGLIIGSWFKERGQWFNRVDKNRVSTLMNTIN